MKTGNNYSVRTLASIPKVESIEECQTSCNDNTECGAFMYDDETGLCETKPSRTPNTLKSPNTLFCAADARMLFLFFFLL
jgi:hypothetical protein